jgi:heat shock protein HslJ/uncharacterized lipoprotein NlpE involved in copper resistance
MDRLLIIIGIIFTTVSLSSCSDEATRAHSELTGSTYSGITPCADCRGIYYTLTFKDDHRYQSSSMYIGESNRGFNEQGNWAFMNDSTIALNKGSNNVRQLRIRGARVIMLDVEGQEITGPLAGRYALTKDDSLMTDKYQAKNVNETVDFRATGNEPFWNLEIDFDKVMKFTTLNGDSIQTPVPPMQQDTSGKARILNVKTESGSLNIQLYPTGCLDSMSGKVSDYAVTVNYGRNSFKGCGRFIMEAYKINDTWKLDQINGFKIHPTNMVQQVPMLQFDLREARISGHTGCNQLNGRFTRDKKNLAFSAVATTKRACPGNLESRFLEALNRVDSYDIANAELLLMRQQDTLMVLQRPE